VRPSSQCSAAIACLRGATHGGGLIHLYFFHASFLPLSPYSPGLLTLTQVEKVMKFATEHEVDQFLDQAPLFEKMLHDSGIIIIKYWFSISDEEQQHRFKCRIADPLKRWKLSPMDLKARIKWEKYTEAKEETFRRTHIPEAPWYLIKANDKRRARLNCMAHLLQLLPSGPVQPNLTVLPDRSFHDDYERHDAEFEQLLLPEYLPAAKD
jgi:hypothetical protein